MTYGEFFKIRLIYSQFSSAASWSESSLLLSSAFRAAVGIVGLCRVISVALYFCFETLGEDQYFFTAYFNGCADHLYRRCYFRYFGGEYFNIVVFGAVENLYPVGALTV